MGVAVDSRGNIWVANSGLISVPCPSVEPPTSPGGSLTLIGPGGRLRSSIAFTGGGLTVPGGHQIVAFIGLAARLKTPLIGPPRRS